MFFLSVPAVCPLNTARFLCLFPRPNMQQAMSCHNNCLQHTKQTQRTIELNRFHRKAAVKGETCSSNWQQNCNITITIQYVGNRCPMLPQKSTTPPLSPATSVLVLAACTCKPGLIGPHYMKEFCVGNAKRK